MTKFNIDEMEKRILGKLRPTISPIERLREAAKMRRVSLPRLPKI